MPQQLRSRKDEADDPRATLAATIAGIGNGCLRRPAPNRPPTKWWYLHVEGAALKARRRDRRQSAARAEQPARKVTLVGADGKTVTLTGPVDRHAGCLRGAAGLQIRFGRKRARVRSRAILGALCCPTNSVRRAPSGSSAPPRRPQAPSCPTAWAVNVEQSGTKCVAVQMSVKLWRPDTHQCRGQAPDPPRAERPDRQRRSGLPVRSSCPSAARVFRGRPEPRRQRQRPFRSEMKFSVMPAGLDKPTGEQAAWMARNNCRDQALAMVDRIR